MKLVLYFYDSEIVILALRPLQSNDILEAACFQHQKDRYSFGIITRAIFFVFAFSVDTGRLFLEIYFSKAIKQLISFTHTFFLFLIITKIILFFVQNCTVAVSNSAFMFQCFLKMIYNHFTQQRTLIRETNLISLICALSKQLSTH